MSAVTLASLRSTIRSRGDVPLSRKFSNEYLNAEIQTSWADLHELIEDVNEGYFDKDGTVTTTASTAFVALPSDCWKVKAIDILDGGEYRELRQIAIGERNRYGATTDMPDAYRLTERGVDLFPTPNAVYTLRVTYARVVTPLSESSPTTMPNEWHDYVIWSVIVRIAASEERPINEYAAMLEQSKQRITRGASKRRQQEPEYLVLREAPADWWRY